MPAPVSRPTSPPREGAALASLLRRADQPTPTDFDQFQRYALAAVLLDRLLRIRETPLRVLEVGSNVLNLLPEFLDPARVQVVRCDLIDLPDGGPNYVRLEAGQPLP